MAVCQKGTVSINAGDQTLTKIIHNYRCSTDLSNYDRDCQTHSVHKCRQNEIWYIKGYV